METITIDDFKANTKEWLIEKLYSMPLDEALLAICSLHDELHKYPKTYKECFNICFGNKHHIVQVLGLDGLGDNKDLFERFIKLKICRDAYWKIAGDWKPDFLNPTKEIRYFLFCTGITIEKGQSLFSSNKILIFPTEEMRDAFYENFKELINDCKELL